MTNIPNYHKSLDPELRAAAQKAQASFKHFWYQVATDFNRIIPALEVACVKAPFSDDFSDPESPVEHMWITEINFDGVTISGTLLNSPNKLSSVAEGDSISLTLDRMEDWLCAMDGRAYGGFTVQVLRSRMNDEERSQHDDAWGLGFPPPDTFELPERSAEFEENVLHQLQEQIKSEPICLKDDFGEGRTLLHLMCLYGRPSAVRALLDAGADPQRTCDRGWTPLDYAKVVGWDDITSQFQRTA